MWRIVVFVVMCILILSQKRCYVALFVKACKKSQKGKMIAPFLKRREGMILVLVIFAVIIIMIYSATIISQSMTEAKLSQDAIDEIKAEQIAKGVFWQNHSNNNFGPAPTVVNDPGGKTYTATTRNTGNGSYTIQVTY